MKASNKVWVCEQGHVDDHHKCPGDCAVPRSVGAVDVCASCEVPRDMINTLCSRCGGTCELLSLDALAREYRERLRVNVGLIAENTKLKRVIAEGTKS
jgi:hypothetical protein